MEIVIAVFVGVWIMSAAISAYIRLKKDYEQDKREGGDKS